MLTRRGFNALVAGGLAAGPLFMERAAAQPVQAAGAVDAVQALEAAIGPLPQLHAVLVQRGDEVVFAAAPRGPGLDRQANIKSCSKSIVALLLGIAIARGEISGLDARLDAVAPAIIPSDATAGVEALTMEDLVTLRAGLEATSGSNYGAWVGSANWLAYALRRPMIAVPGARMIYSTGTTHILGAALAVATGENLLAQARSRLGAVMDFSISPWTRDPQGYYLGGNEMALTPRAMLKIAVMVRDQGRFGDRQIVSSDWVASSLVARSQSPYSGLRYGYGWFLSQSGFAVARGYGGQIIAAHPGRGLAVAITSDPTQPARSQGYFGTLMDLLDGPILALGA